MTSHLYVGTADHDFLQHTKPPFLFVGSGPALDAFRDQFPRAKLFDIAQHSFNPVRDIDYLQQCAFISIMMEAFPAGESTLTKEGVPDVFFEALAQKPKRLDQLFTGKSDDPSYLSAQRMVRRILRSPVLSQVLSKPTNFSFKGSVIARIDPAELAEFDALLLAWLLIGQHKGQIVVPDSGLYLRPLHLSLIRQNRLTAGLQTFAEIEDRKLRQALELIPDKQGAGCTYDDAIVLAQYAGLNPGQVSHTEFVQALTVPPAQM
jgi:hypothetical protein